MSNENATSRLIGTYRGEDDERTRTGKTGPVSKRFALQRSRKNERLLQSQ